MKTHMTCEVTARHRFNWIILMAPGLPCECYEIHSEAVGVLFSAFSFGSRFDNVLLIHYYVSIKR